MKARKLYKLFTWSGVPIYLHWSAALLLGCILLLTLSGGYPLLLLALSLVVLMLVHEAGHATIARHLGFRVRRIVLYPVHGICEYEGSVSRHEHSLVAWGGVSAQAALLLPALALASSEVVAVPRVFGLSLGVFTYINVATIALNLLPLHPFDGASAWRLLGAQARRRR